MQWRGRRQSTNVSDRRGGGGGFSGGRGGGLRVPIRAGGGGGIGFLLIIGALWLFFGINPLTLLGMTDGGGNAPTRTAQGPGVQGTADETDDFIATVLADTEDVWNARFEAAGETYPEPTLVLFTNTVSSGCGFAGAATGPFYCPRDQSLYLDLGFFGQLANDLDAPGDFAQAYVIAHEVGHHVQNVMGTLGETQRLRQQLPEAEANRISVQTELQADCYAGVWAHDVYQDGYLDDGDIDEALNAASQIGDDTLQRRSQGTVVPDSFTHGTSEQRQTWFRRGYESGETASCDTFAGAL
ncbi:KPN_02809 family neutral zinc metallopeptidase [Aureimonas mangrovi]|uniref:KPN_02809 family neutral zinc metallopeptidase n=1 Tax=Aureimonas mangrovi TaxID=2758041 RepID=UPI00163D5019|nr:neutral zinc metallopeptidase [Aureimonas mangrovi]